MRLSSQAKKILAQMRGGARLYRYSVGTGKTQNVTYKLGGIRVDTLTVISLLTNKQIELGHNIPHTRTVQLKLSYNAIIMDPTATAQQIANHFMQRHNTVVNRIKEVSQVDPYSMAYGYNASFMVTLANNSLHTINCSTVKKAYMVKQILEKIQNQ